MAEAAQKKAPEGENAAAAAPAAPKKDLIGIILLALVTLNVAGLGGLGFLVQKLWLRINDVQTNINKMEQSDNEEPSPTGKELQPQNLGVLYPMDSFTVNLQSDQGPKFLQTQMEFELSDPSLEDEISRKKAAVRDSILVLLTSKTYKELREPNGMKKLRQDIVRSVNSLLGSGKVKEIYFTQFHFN